MAYTNFTLDDLKEKFDINNKIISLFKDIKEIAPSDLLKQLLDINKVLPIKTEKAKSEYIISPILTEIVRKNIDIITIYSGEVLDANKKQGLYGECDFILSKNNKTFNVSFPMICVVEAKKGDLELGVAQCSAQMVGIKFFNEKHKTVLNTIYGCVTNANEWKFLKLENNTVFIDQESFYIKELNKILGVFQYIIDDYKKKSII
ncbi:MAG: hypothetical protein U0457_13350 [Candidatus Sericytochromatia bacterium]